MPREWSREDERQYQEIGKSETERGRSEERTRDELDNLARERDVAGRSRMTESELVRALRRR